MSNPPPRPALRRASDAGVSPARVSASPTTAPGISEQPKKTKKGKKGGDTKPVALNLPKKLHKQLDARAKELGYDPNDVLEMLVHGWLDG